MTFLGDLSESKITVKKLGQRMFSKKINIGISDYRFNSPSKIKEMLADGWKVIVKEPPYLRCYLFSEGDSVYICVKHLKDMNVSFKPFKLPFIPFTTITSSGRLKILAKN